MVGLLGAQVAEHALGAPGEGVGADSDILSNRVVNKRIPVSPGNRVYGLTRGKRRREICAGEQVEPEQLIRAESGDQVDVGTRRAVQLSVVDQVADQRGVQDRLVPRLADTATGVGIYVEEIVDRRLIGNQQRLVGLGRQPEQHAEVRLHLCELECIVRIRRAVGHGENEPIERVTIGRSQHTIHRRRRANCGSAIEVAVAPVPELPPEGEPDQIRVRDAKSRFADCSRTTESGTDRAALVGEGPEPAVSDVHQLVRQRRHRVHTVRSRLLRGAVSLVLDGSRVSLEQLLADLGPVPAGERHLEVAEGRPVRLGRQAGELDPDRLSGDFRLLLYEIGPDIAHGRAGESTASASGQPRVDEDVRRGVRRAEHAAAVVDEAGAPVPEVVEVERRPVHGRRVARLHPAQAFIGRNRVGHDGAYIRRQRPDSAYGGKEVRDADGRDVVEQLESADAHRGHDVIGVGKRICGVLRALVERKVGGHHVRVGRLNLQGRKVPVGAKDIGIQLALRPVIDPGVEVARAARLDTVASDLHVPEQGFSKRFRPKPADIGLQRGGNVRGIGRVPVEIFLVDRRLELGDRNPFFIDEFPADEGRYRHDGPVRGDDRTVRVVVDHQAPVRLASAEVRRQNRCRVAPDCGIWTRDEVPNRGPQDGRFIVCGIRHVLRRVEHRARLIPAHLTIGGAPAQRLRREEVIARRIDPEGGHGCAETVTARESRCAEVALVLRSRRIVGRTVECLRILQELVQLLPQGRLFQRTCRTELDLDLDRQLHRPHGCC